MTCIAWDGEMLVADKAATNCGFSNTVTKIYRVPGGMVGFSGNGDAAMHLLEWFKSGRDPAKFPEIQKTDDCASALFIDAKRRAFGYEKSPFPQQNEQKFMAMGSGRDYALAVMYLGHNAICAVEVACALNNDCGNGIDVLEFE